MPMPRPPAKRPSKRKAPPDYLMAQLVMQNARLRDVVALAASAMRWCLLEDAMVRGKGECLDEFIAEGRRMRGLVDKVKNGR